MSNRKNKTVDLLGEKFTLSERDAFDVLELQTFVKTTTIDDDSALFLIQATRAIESALRPNIHGLKWYQFIKRIRYGKKLHRKALMKRLTVKEINDLFVEVLRLENLIPAEDIQTEKKKVKRSVESSVEL